LSIRHPPFHTGFIFAGLSFALWAGFALGAHLAAVVGFDFPLGPGFYAFIQVHGHLQLLGWVGLFVMGISLHFIPRLTHHPLAFPALIPWIFFLMVTGLFFRLLAQCTLPYLTGPLFIKTAQLGLVSSGGIEFLAILLYIFLLSKTVMRVSKESISNQLLVAKPFFGIMLVGWLAYGSINFAVVLDMAKKGTFVASQELNLLAVRLFVNGTILPIAFAFCFLTFPLFLRLPIPRIRVRLLAGLFATGMVSQIISPWFFEDNLDSQFLFLLSHAGQILKGACVVWVVWETDVFTRRRKPWIALREKQAGPNRKPSHPGLPDYGEYGRFEWLIYSALCWLVVGAILELLMGSLSLLGISTEISADAVRHCYLVLFDLIE